MSKTFLLSILSFFIVIKLFAQETVNVNNIEIVRDNYGVPHIFSKTDVEAVYGIAWAQCEDNFNRLQENFAMVKGLAGRLQGKEGAIADFIYKSFQIEDFVERRYKEDVGIQMENMLKAYASAVNKYAQTHPEEVESKKIFPVTAKELLESYALSFLFTHNSILELAKLLSKDFDYATTIENGQKGSNAFAFNKNITTDGKAYLIANPHQPINAIDNFWELSVHSEEGLDIYGATFAGGGLTPVIGSNKNLGWTHTTNYENCSDVYQLEMHPSKKNLYKYDGEWLPLEVKKAKLKVKIGPVTIPVSKKYYLSKYGPTFKKKADYYSYKSATFYNLKAPEQWYKMGLAKNLKEFKEAIEIRGVPLQTITYADKENNIFHLSITTSPVRDESFDWQNVLKGNTSKNNWDFQNIHPVEDAPQIENPNCGYVYDCNNTPLRMTAPEENLKAKDFPDSFHLLESNTIRANSFENSIKKYKQISFEEARKLRENVIIDKHKLSFRNCMNCDKIPMIINKNPKLKAVKKVFDKWDGSYDVNNKQASFMALASMYFADYVIENFGNVEQDIPEEEIVKAILKAEKFLMKHYGTLEVELGKVQKAVRFDTELPMYGGINTIASAHFVPYKKGKIKLKSGDSFIFYAKYGKDGLEEFETVNAFGNSSKKGHPHSMDQTELYVNMKTKKAELDIQKLKATGKAHHPK